MKHKEKEIVADMTFPELVDWARGHALIEIGKGKYEDAIWLIVHQAWQRGFQEGEKQKSKGKKK